MMSIYIYLFCTWEAFDLFQCNLTDPESFLSPSPHVSITGRKEEVFFSTQELQALFSIHKCQINSSSRTKRKQLKKFQNDQQRSTSSTAINLLETTFVTATERGSFNSPQSLSLRGQRSTEQHLLLPPELTQPTARHRGENAALTCFF